nr:ABC transporter ATP-binding protein [Micromonospora sp. DSM 115978]
MSETVGKKLAVLERAGSGPLLEVAGLRVSYRSRSQTDERVQAVRQFDLSLAAGERVAIVGESGSGKSTVCLALAGFVSGRGVAVAADRFAILGVDEAIRTTFGGLPRRRDGVAMMFQDAMTALDPVWTVRSQFGAVLRAAGFARAKREAEARSWLRRVGLDDVERVLRARPYELSGGMRQRVMLALSMASRPRVLIADEPTSALDASLARGMMRLICDIVGEAGTALLVVSHDIALTREFCDRMLVMYGGCVVEEGESTELAALPRHAYTGALLKSVPTLAHAAAPVLPTISPAPVPYPDIAADGCPFRFRCARRTEVCETMPETSVCPSDRADHLVRCWHPARSAAA